MRSLRKNIHEAEIHFNLFAELKSEIKSPNNIFTSITPELKLESGKKADLVVYYKSNPLLVIECKKTVKGKISRKIDPLSSDVIGQALGYAVELGASYFCTYNGEVGALFQTFQPGVNLYDRNYKVFTDIHQDHSFFSDLICEATSLAYKDNLEWADIDEQFIGRMSSIHSILCPAITEKLIEIYNEKPASKLIKDIKSWFHSFGVDWDDKKKTDILSSKLPSFAMQASYVFLDKLLFYKVLEKKYRKLPSLTSGNKSIFKIIEECFASILEIDYLPIFHPDTLFSKTLLFQECEEEVTQFVNDLSQIRLDNLDGDLLGTIYEKLIPPEVRHKLGQYYTPPQICSLLSSWAIRSSSDAILDPACGSGGFLNIAYDVLKSKDKSLTHEEVLDRLHGIEINRFPAHLSAMNLALKELDSHTNFINITVKDFFNRGLLDSVGSSKLDSIIGNPPYIRQELINDKDTCREHLDNDKLLSNRSDIYIYFISKCLKMLKENGRLAFIVSNRWLMTDYGDKFQKYLLDYCTPSAFVVFDKNVFSDALIGTVCLFLNSKSRNINSTKEYVKFIRIKEDMTESAVLKLVNKKVKNEIEEDNEKYSQVIRSVAFLKESDISWRSYLFTHNVFKKLLHDNSIKKVSDFCDIEFGIKTGSNEFFYLRDEDIKSYGLKQTYFKPLLKSVGQLESTDFKRQDTEWRVLDLNSFAEKFKVKKKKEYDKYLEEIKNTRLKYKKNKAKLKNEISKIKIKLNKSVKQWLKSEGHNNLVNYLKIGEHKKINEIPSIMNREVWWDLGKLPLPTYAMTKEVWREYRVPILFDKMICDQHLYPVFLKSTYSKYSKAVGAILSSNFMWLMRESMGREASGQAMARNEITVQEAQNLFFPDIEKLSKENIATLEKNYDLLINSDRNKDFEKKEKSLKEIDKVVLSLIDTKITVKDLRDAVSFSLERRIMAGHMGSDLMISSEQKHKEILEKIRKGKKVSKKRKVSTRRKKQA